MTQTTHHFFAASIFDWATTTPERSLPELIDLMEKQGHDFNLYLVPVPYDTEYKIYHYQPHVEGTQWLGHFQEKKQ